MSSADGFGALGVREALVEVLRGQGMVAPFDVQREVVPDVRGGHDVLVQARTGQGKTLAYALGLVDLLVDRAAAAAVPRALVLVPTRELARQVARVVEPLAACASMRVACVHGGTDPGAQVAAMHGASVVVACPGRLTELVGRGDAVLSQIEIVVLDEADQLADAGFAPVVRALLSHVPPHASRVLVSATLGDEVAALLGPDRPAPLVHRHPDDAPAGEREEHLWVVPHWHRRAVLRRLAGGSGKVILFSRTRHGARRLADDLTGAGIANAVLHGELAAEVRFANLAAFAEGDVDVLVATDVAARGLHLDDVPLVVHVEPPNDPAAYVHRSGRTARAGRRGAVVMLAMPDQRHRVEALRRAGVLAAAEVAIDPEHPVIDDVLATAAALAAQRPSG